MSKNFRLYFQTLHKNFFYFSVSGKKREKSAIIASYSFCLHQVRVRVSKRHSFHSGFFSVSYFLMIVSFHFTWMPFAVCFNHSNTTQGKKERESDRVCSMLTSSSSASCARQFDWKPTDRMRTKACKVFASIYMCTVRRMTRKKVRTKSLARRKNEDKRKA